MEDCEGPFCFLQGTTDDVPEIGNVMPGAGLAELAIVFANIAILIAAGLSTIGLAYSFVLYVTSAGDPKAAQRAQRALFWSIVAMIVSLIAWAVKTVLFNLLGVDDIY